MRGSLLAVSALALVLVACGGGSKGNEGPSCGNGIVEAGELCDSGPSNSNTFPGACRLNCQPAGCGDGVVDSAEECDDGNKVDTDGCTTLCKKATCGDGFVQAGEACDDGARNSDSVSGACRTDCTTHKCGDGIKDPDEQCDDGNTIPGDACTNTCTTPRCGDGIRQSASEEECDDGASNSDILSGACRSNCTKAHCGDGVKDDGEACDDGNQIETDGCSNACALPVCGDGIVQTGEECDDGAENSDSRPDGCRQNCKKARCGDGARDTGEECDDGNTVDTDTCTSRCKGALCGDGIVEAGVEECDDGAANSNAPDACRPICKKAHCGDKVVDSGETCDDGNTVDTDDCTNACQIAGCGDGVVHAGSERCDNGPDNSDTVADACRTTCQPAGCGDGVVDTGEGCDDGNKDPTDACNSLCQPARCGDGFVQAGVEECDDGDKNSDKDPNACRTTCKAPVCGDGVQDRGESCDDGNNNDGDGCTATCVLEMPGVGGELSLNGSLDKTDLTWSRPNADCVTTNKGSYYYDVLQIVNSGKDTLNLAVGVNFQDNGYLFLYGPNFDAGDPTSQCLVGDDDASGNSSTSVINGYQVAAGDTVTVVITANAASKAIGSWSFDLQVSVCGDGSQGPGETCDDGNTVSGDGCSATCQNEEAIESEPNDDFDSANEVIVGSHIKGAIDPWFENDIFYFQATGGTTYDIRTWAGAMGTCDGNNPDTYFEIYDSDINYWDSNNDAVFSWPCSELGWTAPFDGKFYIMMYGFSGDTIDPYYLEITEVGFESEGNDDTGSANALANRHTVQGTITQQKKFLDTDFYSFDAKANQTYSILTYAGQIGQCYTANGNSSEAYISVFDGDGNYQTGDDGDGYFPCAYLNFTPSADGTYYIEVDGYDTIDPYFLQIYGP